MKQLIYILSLILISGAAMPAFAVTEKEMEQARTIATKAYLRYANDGSGYLDRLNPKSMAELERNLKPKEKENLKAFKAIPVPSGYESWNKQKLVEYWGVTAFASKGLIEKGRLGRNRAKKNIGAMKITPPANESPAKKAEQPKTTSPQATQPKPVESQAAPQHTPDVPVSAEPDSAAALVQDPAEAAALESLAALDEEPQIKKAKNHTWVYILILCVLVGVVVALVVFASNVMKKNGMANMTPQKRQTQKREPEEEEATNSLREKFAATLSSKNEEIRNLSKKLEAINSQNSTLKGNLESLTKEAAVLRSRLDEASKRIKELEQATNVRETSTPPQAAQAQAQVEAKPKTVPLRTIYLGRANAKGIFIRADRSLNIGNSIYRLDTTDGYAGSFRVVNDPTVWEMALLTPRESLAGACSAADIDSTAGMHKIVNDSAGTAIFEGGCWKVIRKAKVHYE